MNPIAFQDQYPEADSHCYGCGRSNLSGHQLKSYWVDDSPNETIARFTPASYWTGGVPNHVYGGLIASLLDCHGTASASAFKARADQSDSDSPNPGTLPRCVTASLKVDYLKPTPIGVELELRGELVNIERRKIFVRLSLRANDTVCATAEMLAVQIQ